MWVIVLEAGLALVLLGAIVWVSVPRRRGSDRKGEAERNE